MRNDLRSCPDQGHAAGGVHRGQQRRGDGDPRDNPLLEPAGLLLMGLGRNGADFELALGAEVR